jgi:hypothetical protein
VGSLAVNDLPAHTTVKVTCKTKKKKQQKKSCPRKRTATSASARSKLNLRKPFKKKRLPPGTRVTITITAPGFIGKEFRYTMRKGKAPKPPRKRCIPPGGKPGKCT